MKLSAIEKEMQDFLNLQLALKHYSQNTIDSYREDLRTFAKYLNLKGIDSPEKITRRVVRNYLEYMAKRLRYSKVTINRKISTLSMFLRYLAQKKIISNTILYSITRLHTHRKLPRILTPKDIARLAKHFYTLKDSSPIILRDAAIILGLYATGLRISELFNIKLEDINWGKREIRVKGKGDKERIVFFSAKIAEIWQEYLKTYRSKIKTSETYLFVDSKGKKIKPNMGWYIVRKWGYKVLGRLISPHDLRHTFATHLLNKGINIKIIQELLGHASIKTTQRYTHLAYDEIKKTLEKLHPYNN